MDTLALSPLPTERRGESRIHLRDRNEGFVDEELVSGVIARGVYESVFVQPEGMALSSSEDDFAGWTLPVPSPFRGMPETQAPAPAPLRRPAPPAPVLYETGIAPPYAGGHRWWLFGVGGAMICGFLSLTLLSLAQRLEVRRVAPGLMPVPVQAEAPATRAAEPAVQSALTRARPDFR